MKKYSKRVVRGRTWRIVAPVLFFIVAVIVSPACLLAEGETYFSCVDRDGNVTVTNRHYDERAFRCAPFSDLNKAFKQAETSAKKTPPPVVAARPDREVSLAAEHARISAESARTSMEAARTAAEAAHLTAEAARFVLTPHLIVIAPQHPITTHRHHDRFCD